MGNKVKKILREIRSHYRFISIKDRCLIIIMTILLLQCAYSLFTGDGKNPNSRSIDIVMRTTVSAIFGYFISANFLNKENEGKEINNQQEKKDIIQPNTTCACTITHEKKEIEQLVEEEKYMKEQTRTYVKVQIIITAGIAIFALIILILARNVQGGQVESLPQLSQFRDFVSGCIGFLIGVPEQK